MTSRFSTTKLIAIAVVAILILGAVGVLAATTFESERELPSPRPIDTSQRNAGVKLNVQIKDRFANPASSAAAGLAEDLDARKIRFVFDGEIIATIPVPDGWDETSLCGGDSQCAELQGSGDYVYVQVVDSADNMSASDWVAEMYAGNWVLQDEHYSQVDASPVTVQRLGSRARAAFLTYSGLYSALGSFWVVGELFAVVRADGWTVLLQMYSSGATPDDAFDAFAASEGLTEIFDGLIESFVP
jgi:hypothetical protein